jgi:hypothetical protein
MQSKILKDLSKRLFAGSAAQLALHALSMEPASEIELAEIRAIIERKRNPTGSDQRPAIQSTNDSRKDRP